MEEEGLGYSLCGYFTSDISEYTDDPKLKKLWKEASEAVKKLEAYIEPLWEEVAEEDAED